MAIDGPDAGSTFYQLRDTLSSVKGRHSIRVGGDELGPVELYAGS
jgi:hypothetical protein